MWEQALLSVVAAWIAMAAWMGLAWWFQRLIGNAGWIDVFWTVGTGLACVAVALIPGPAADPIRQTFVALLAGLWSARLTLYLARRVASSPEDLRYVALREQWGKRFQPRLLRFVMWQPPVSALLALTVHLAAHKPGPMGLRDLMGLAILAAAILGEALSDAQMRRYKEQQDRPPVMDRGLWGRSRHPNYFFEWLAWTAYPAMTFSFAAPVSWLTLLAPAVMYLVLRFGTGVPLLEKSMAERKSYAFRDYQRRVNAFFPSLFRPGTSRMEQTQ